MREVAAGDGPIVLLRNGKPVAQLCGLDEEGVVFQNVSLDSEAGGIAGEVLAPAPSLETITYHVVDLAQDYGAQSVCLFGSFTRGDAREDSDVDILLGKGAIKGMRVLDFQDELSKRIGRKVDVVTTVGASERFLNRIKPDCIELYRSVS